MFWRIIQRIGVLSAAKILAATYAALGLLFGGLMTLASLLGAAAAFSQSQGGGAFIYNLVAGVVGGIELDVE